MNSHEKHENITYFSSAKFFLIRKNHQSIDYETNVHEESVFLILVESQSEL